MKLTNAIFQISFWSVIVYTFCWYPIGKWPVDNTKYIHVPKVEELFKEWRNDLFNSIDESNMLTKSCDILNNN